MKLKWAITFIAICAATTGIFIGCGSDDDNNNDNSRDYTWLLGTWEGTTPDCSAPLGGKKMRIVFTSAQLIIDTLTPGGSVQKVYAYEGTFTFDVDGTPWTQTFSASNWPYPNFNVILWGYVVVADGQVTENISIRIARDAENTCDADWTGVGTLATPRPSFDIYGDAEQNAEQGWFMPDDGCQTLVLTKI